MNVNFVIVTTKLITFGHMIFLQSGSNNEKEIQLRAEIKQLLKEAGLMSQPSAFAQAAKLKRLAADKERELSKCEFISCCNFFTFVVLSCAMKCTLTNCNVQF
ncbi:hypothetical protein E2542_SST10964 [Spatholobus suberectus]|nr:hypothetical protein E2542_SST10964 [Spatholobus suberectus]